jgi:hypothetical protein
MRREAKVKVPRERVHQVSEGYWTQVAVIALHRLAYIRHSNVLLSSAVL